MGKKSSSSQPSQADPMSPSFEPPRMDPPPPYDTVTRSSTTSSVRSVDRLDPDATGPNQPQQDQNLDADATGANPATAGTNGASGRKQRKKCGKKHSGGGCMNHGNDVNGCMNYGDGSDGCMNYESPGGCMNYRSTGGCMNYEVNSEEWKGNEGCMNYRRGGGCLLSGD